MASVNEISSYLDGLAPFSTQMAFDNAGFLVGQGGQSVRKILVALDITEAVIDEAAELGAELIVSHHPVIFGPVKSITDRDPTGRKLLALTQKNIAAICLHTNLDMAPGGVNDALARRLDLMQCSLLQQEGVGADGKPYGIGRVGHRESPASLPAFAAFVKLRLGANGVRYVDCGKPVSRVAVGGGACGDMLQDALNADCDTFVTADVKYHEFLEAQALGLNLVDAGHYPTENVICPVLADWLEKGFPEVQVFRSKRHHEVFSYL
ncbi:MAG: Nif3-like dinuclear metal center hexameric protein [Pseudoflavonifractor sp.]